MKETINDTLAMWRQPGEEVAMNNKLRQWTILVAFGFLTTLSIYAAPGKKQTFTGEVGDAMCGRNHMEGTPTDCTRTCVAHGSKYALVVGDKMYILETSDKAALATLDQQAGKNATVTGVLDGNTIQVSSVKAK
jgi:hypothetical protein